MKRWYWLPAALLLAFSACDDKDANPSAGRSSGGAVAEASSGGSAQGGTSDAGATVGQLSSFAAATPPASDEAAAGNGARFFDGEALRGAGFEVPGGETPVVYAGSEGTRRSSLIRGAAGSGARKDLDAAAPPLPDSADFPADGAAQARGAGKVLAEFAAFQRRMYGTVAPIISRAGWHAVKRRERATAMTPTHVTIHHTEGPQTMTEAATAAAVRGIQHYHMAGRAAQGLDVWDDIGYHFLIDGAGRVIEGRPAETLGAHAGGANMNNIGIAVMGNFDKIKPTPQQVESLTRLVSFLALKYGQDPTHAGFLEGHRHYDNTDCPGKNMMAILDSLRAKIGVETAALASRLSTASKGEFVPVLTDA